MSSVLNNDILRNVASKTTIPVVLKGFIKNWPVCQWNVEKWCSVFADKEIPFRCMRKDCLSDEPCWERRCNIKSMTFNNFVNSLETSDEWMYFDYKYLHQWFDTDSELYNVVSWKDFGYPNKTAKDTTLWVGSCGAHTPAHQDTYGFNIVAQVHGKKRWILFPPETRGLKPTRVPYEESSIYSELNFYCPSNIEQFKEVSGGHMVELSPGDALIVPCGWWHYVQNMEALNITMNMWLPHENDFSTRVSEALIKIIVAQICKDLPEETAKLLVNPNEDDISDTPLAVLFLQLETVANIYLDNRRKVRRVKRQKKSEDDTTSVVSEEYDLNTFIENKVNNLETVPSLSNEHLIELLKQNLKDFANLTTVVDADDDDGSTTNLCLTKAVIDAFSQNNVIELVKQNLFTRLSQ